MTHQITNVLAIIIVLMTQGVTLLSTCESKSDFSENLHEITSTKDYLELNRKHIEYAADDVFSSHKYPENKIEHNGCVYYSNEDGLFVQQVNATTAEKINGFPKYTSIFLDKNFNLVYFGTNQGLSVVECGGRKVTKIGVTDGISIAFGVIDNLGNVYVGNNGPNYKKSIEELFVLTKSEQKLVKINGIEKSLGSYTIESITNPNKIAVDTRNNIYVGAYMGYIYVLEAGQTTATKLKDIKSTGGVSSVVVDSKDNVFFRTNHALYVLKQNERKLTTILEFTDDFNYFLSIDKSDNLYFQVISKTYVLKSDEVNAVEINTFGITTNSTYLRNIQVKNNILYVIIFDNHKEIICAIKPNETSLTEIYTTTNSILSMAIDNSNNIFYVTYANDSLKLVPFILRKNSNIPIEIRGVTGHLSVIFSDNKNNIFFGSGNGLHVLQDGEVTPLKLRATESQVSSHVVDDNDNVYFGTDYDGAFVLKSGELEASPIDGINTNYGSYVEVYGDRKYDVLYFKTGGALYKLNGGETSVMKISEGYSPDLYLTNCMNDTYFVRTIDEMSSIFSVKYNDTEETHITDLVGQVLQMNSDSFNNLYFITDKNQILLLRSGQVTPIIIAKNQKFSSLKVDRSDSVYFIADGVEAYVLRVGEIEATKIKNISGEFKYFITNGDDNVFVTATNDIDHRLFLVRSKLQFDATFPNRYLGEIDNNEDETIFNILNYLNAKENYFLTRKKNKILNKTATSATVLAVDGKFKGRFDVTYTMKSRNDENIGNFKFVGLLKKAIFFDHINKNLYNFRDAGDVQKISVSIEDLRFFPVEVTTNSEPLSSVEFKNICFNKKRVANTSPLPQTIKVPECHYETKETSSFQITTGLDKNNMNVEESVASLVLNSDDENVILNFVNVNGDQDVTPTSARLSGDFDLSNLNQHTHEVNLHNFVEDEQEIILPPKKRLLVNYSVRTFVVETNLNLKQKIKGTIVAKIEHAKSDETVQITIKEAMQILKKYNLMPRDEISINQDSSITFIGRAKLIVNRESEPKIIRNFYDV